MRIGHGYDAHRFAKKRKLVLGATEIEHECGLEAHSDGDVVLHALTDAILGAAGMPDIGNLLPDTDEEYRDADSRIFLREALRRIRLEGMEPEYADMTVVAQKPKLAGYIREMRENIAKAMETDVSRVNIKATTEEKMGFTGRGEGISAHAVVLLREENR